MEKKKIINKSLLISLSTVSIILGILFIIQLIRIYFFHDGNGYIYSRDKVGSYLLQILAVIIIWIILVIATYIVVRPFKDTNVVKSDNEAKLNIILNKIDKEKLYEITEYKKLNTYTLITTIITSIILLICTIFSGLYVFNFKNFDITESGDLVNSQVINMIIHLTPWIIIALLTGLFYSYYTDYLNGKKLDIAKASIKDLKIEKSKSINNKKEKIYLILKLSIITIAVVLIIVGLSKGDYTSVLDKAIKICTECIGLG